jgi:acetolactate decarboxylase
MIMRAVQRAKSVTQFSTINALLVGLYDGVFPVREVMKCGHIGLGCSDRVSGEVIVVDGECYLARGGEAIARMRSDEPVPFAEVADLEAADRIETGALDKERLTDRLLSLVRSRNLFIGVRLDGEFDAVTVRRPPPVPHKPYPPLVDLLAHQDEEHIAGCTGTLVGFWAPKEYQGVTVAGLHIHFIDADRKRGGHVLDFRLKGGRLSYGAYTGVSIQLPATQAFLGADLAYRDIDAHIHQSEG